MPTDPSAGDGWAAAAIGDLGEGPGFRKIRQALGVTAFGVNAIVLPPGHASRRHRHERQQELYVVLEGEIEFRFGDGETYTAGPQGVVRVDAPTVRSLRNVSDADPATYLCVGGEGGYVGRDGVVP